MPLNIEPIHIGVVVAAIIGGLAWYFTRKTRRDDSAAHEVAERMIKGLKEQNASQVADNGGLTDAISHDEPEVPKLKPEDEDREAALEAEQVPTWTPAPEPEVVAQPDEPLAVTEGGRSSAVVDDVVEAVVNFTPTTGQAFTAQALEKAVQTVSEAQNKELISIDFYDSETARWYHDASLVKNCTQIYLSMLLANRNRKVDSLAASIFITLAGQMAIDLNAEAVLPDSQTMVEKAENIASTIKAFDNQLTLKIVCAHDVDTAALRVAALDCGFVEHEMRYEKPAAFGTDPMLVISVSKTLPNELELTMDVALVSAANDPLAQYFAVANDLCCKIDGMLTDMQGNPVESPSAAIIAQQLRELHANMAAHGVPAGSTRALRIFSRI